MSALEDRLAFRTIDGDPVTWQRVLSPFDCDYFQIFNAGASAVFLRTNPNDPATQIAIGSGGAEVFAATPRPTQVSRFLKGATCLFFQTAAGTGPVICKFVR